MDQAPRHGAYPPASNTGRGGRPRHAETARVAELVAQNLSDRAIVKTLAVEGITICRRTVGRIRRGEQTRRESHSLLNPGERRLAKPMPCPTGCGPITLVPCRTCGADWPPELDQLEAARERRELAMSQRRPPAGGEPPRAIGEGN